jgi:hypothetical protein
MALTICICLLVLLLQVPGQLLISHAFCADGPLLRLRLLLLLLLRLRLVVLMVPGWTYSQERGLSLVC